MAIEYPKPVAMKLISATAFFSLLCGGGHSEEKSWVVEGSIAYDRAPNDDSDGQAKQLRLQDRPSASLNAVRGFNVATNQTAELSLGIATERYPDSQGNDRLFFDAGLNYSIRVDQGILRRVRIFGEARSARNDHHGVFNRVRLGGALHMQPARQHSIQLRARLGHRDQNDEQTFRGYDQSELLTDLAHNWRSKDNKIRTNATLFAERRSADRDIYSYDEAGLRLIGRYALSERLELNARSVGFVRDYKQGGREDRRLRGTLGLSWNFTTNTALEGYAGYQRNRSTFLEKDYEGGVFGLQLSHRFTRD